MEFRDDVEARAFGNQVIRDLIGTRAEHYYGWTLDIAEGEAAIGGQDGREVYRRLDD
jgi:hypothetical protein